MGLLSKCLLRRCEEEENRSRRGEKKKRKGKRKKQTLRTTTAAPIWTTETEGRKESPGLPPLPKAEFELPAKTEFELPAKTDSSQQPR